MQVSSHVDTPITSGGQLITSVGINGSHQTALTNASNAFILENVDPNTLDDDDSDSDGVDSGIAAHMQQQMHAPANMGSVLGGPKPGKKTKGRVKIKMEFIENKLRRYTTFSKRKTGIMKKAYELSTLTGTQVMLLVASETGHVYTFATRKLQPMITSESGKALIQTCLNSPDPPPFSPGQQQAVEQRMNPSGFEETELTCTVGEEDTKAGIQTLPESLSKPMFPMPSIVQPDQTLQAAPQQTVGTAQPVQLVANTSTQPVATNYMHQTTTATVSQSQPSTKVTSTPQATQNISMQLPTGLILPGTPITIPIQQTGQTGGATQQQQQQQQQTVYRIPSSQLVSVTGGQFQPSSSEASSSAATTAVSTTPSSITMVSDGLLSGSTSSVSSGGNTMTPGIVMYQTPQGVVYATPTALQDRTIFNFQQPATAISVPQSDQQGGSGAQQIITIPVPVSLANSGQVFHLATTATDGGTLEVTQPPVKKSRK